MRSRKEILNDFKMCVEEHGECSKCSYNVNGVCTDNTDKLDREIIELLESLESNLDYKAGLKDGLEEAWNVFKVAWNMDCEDFFQCFGYDDIGSVVKHFTANEAKLKIKEWENKKICVGDIVEEDGVYGVVLDIDGDTLSVLNENRIVDTCMFMNVVKTDKHIDLDNLFKQIEKGGN